MTIAIWLAHDLSNDENGEGFRQGPVASHPPTVKEGSASPINDADRILIQRIRTGDVAAFEALSEQLSDALWRYAYRLVRTSDLAADVVQDVLFNLWQYRERLDAQRNVRAFLFKDTRRRALKLLRREHMVHRKESSSDLSLVSGTSQDFWASATQWTESELDMALDHILAMIPEHRREILLLRWRHKFSYDEIAEILGLGVSAVKMQIHRATVLVRPLLERMFRDRE